MKLKRLSLGQFDLAVFSSLFSHAFVLLMLPVILLPVSNDLGFALEDGGFKDGGLIQVFSGATSIIALLSSGFIVHKIGLKRTFTLALFSLLGGFILLAQADTYFYYVCAMMVAGASGAIVVSLAPAIAHDLHPDDSGKYLSIANSFWSAGMLVTVLVAGYLLNAGYSWRTVILVSAATVILPLFLTVLPNKKSKFPEHDEVSNFSETLNKKVTILRMSEFWRCVILLALVSGAEMSLEMWTASYVQLNFAGSAEAGGFAVGCFSLGMIISRLFSGYIAKQEKIRGFLLGVGLYSIMVSITVPFITSLTVLYIVLFLCGLGAAPMWPYVQSYTIDSLKNVDKTSLLILLTVSGFFGFSFFSWFSGMLATAFDNLNIVYYIAPANYVLFIIILMVGKKQSRNCQVSEAV